MPGTKTSGRPGGNPGLVKYQFTTEREFPCDRDFPIRLPVHWIDPLNEISDWRERARQAFAIEFGLQYDIMPENRNTQASTQPLLCRKRSTKKNKKITKIYTEVVNILLPEQMKLAITNAEYKTERARRAIAHEFGLEFGPDYVDLAVEDAAN